MKKTISKIILILLFLSLITVFVLYNYYKTTLESKISDNPNTKVFVIDPGLSAYQVLAKLKNEGILSQNQELITKIYIKYEQEPQFKEGTFKIPMNITPKVLVEALKTPELTDIWITIPEGLRKDEIAKILSKAYVGVQGAVFSEKEFLSLSKDKEYIYQLGLPNVTDLEGYLFPDKYLMPSQATTDYVIRTLISTFKTKAGEISYNDVIIASMIEREGKSDYDRPLISGVIKKRLKEGWLLQIDATLLYYHKDWKHVITIQDKEINHPYNTYKNLGLPKTPICNPGLAALNAAKNPKSSSYYYYIHANDGKVYFAENLAQHEANIAKYLR